MGPFSPFQTREACPFPGTPYRRRSHTLKLTARAQAQSLGERLSLYCLDPNLFSLQCQHIQHTIIHKFLNPGVSFES